jgi:hypothetical protein
MSTFDPALLLGRWDLTIDMRDGKRLPAWLEIRKSGRQTLVGQFVATHGSARPIHKVKVEGNEFSFAIPPQWEKGMNDLMVEGELAGDRLRGWIMFPDEEQYTGKVCERLRCATPSRRAGASRSRSLTASIWRAGR